MNKYTKFNPVVKSKIKMAFDVVFILALILITLISGLASIIDRYPAITLTIILVAYLFQYIVTKRWVDSSLMETLERKTQNANNTAKKIISISDKQKDEMKRNIDAIKDAEETSEELRNALKLTKQNAQNVSLKANETLDFSQKEQSSVKSNIEKMIILKQKIQIIAGFILDLSEHTQQVGETIYLIEDIAEQTNMLALNAAVEAARAGEHGKGFSIVAGEIRKLADESKQATTKITSLIKNIQQVTNSTVMATEEGSKEIELGVDLADSINKNIDTLINIICEVKIAAEKIYTDSVSQEATSEIVNNTISKVEDGLNSTLKILEDKMEQVNSLDKISDNFKQNIV